MSTCFLFGGGIVLRASEDGGKKFYSDIARALADYFTNFGDGSGSLGAVRSKVGFGVAMLRQMQAQCRMLGRRDTPQRAGGYTSRSGNGDGALPAMEDAPPRGPQTE